MSFDATLSLPVKAFGAQQAATLYPARYYALLVELLRAQGVRVDPLLRRLGLSSARLGAPDALLNLAQVDGLIAAAVKATGCADLGFHLGRLIKPSSHEFLGHALMSCATLDQALRLAARYWRLISPIFSLRLSDTAGGMRIDLLPVSGLRALTLRFHLEAIAAGLQQEIAFLLSGQAAVYDLYLPLDLAGERSRYRQLAPVRVHFVDAPQSGLQLALGRELLARPLALADRHALNVARLRCDQALSLLTRSGSLAEWVSTMLAAARDYQPRQRELAQLLHLSTRTLNRHLATEGTSFRQLGKRSRHDKACALLDAGALSITAIALQLGYQDAANFTRAFRREQGMTPSAFQRRQPVRSSA